MLQITNPNLFQSCVTAMLSVASGLSSVLYFSLYCFYFGHWISPSLWGSLWRHNHGNSTVWLLSVPEGGDTICTLQVEDDVPVLHVWTKVSEIIKCNVTLCIPLLSTFASPGILSPFPLTFSHFPSPVISLPLVVIHPPSLSHPL